MRLNKSVLIVSTWAPPMIGGPQNLYNLFSRISGGYSVLTSKSVLFAINTRLDGSWLPCPYYSLESGEQIFKPQISTSVKSNSAVKQSFAIEKIVRIIKKVPLGNSLIEITWFFISLVRSVRSVKKIVAKERPGSIMGISDMGLALISTYVTAKIVKIPYTIYLFDLYRGNLLPFPFGIFARLFEAKILSGSQIVICTNEITEKYYQRRYGQKIRTAVVHNSIFDRHTVNNYNPQSPYTIVFTGNVYWAQEQAVMNLITAMKKLTDLPITLKLYVPNPPESLKTAIAGKSNIELGAASQDEMPTIQGSATLLFLPLAWDTKAPDIIATATPGKFTDYLASGRPMLVHAPNYAYVSTYTKEHNLGLVVDTNSIDALATAIRDFLANPERGKTFVDNALKVFATNHEATKNAAKLTELLNLID